MSRLTRFLVALLATVFTGTAASASTIAFSILDLTLSTSTTSGINLTALPSSAPGLLPADGTFTLTTSDIANRRFAVNEGKFWRFSFTLPSGFTDLSFAFAVSMNDEYALYLNDTVIAIQSTTTTDNFVDPLPGLTLSAAGVSADPSGKLDYLLSGTSIQSLFVAGANELTIFGTDSPNTGGGGISPGTVGGLGTAERPLGTTVGTISFVPEPSVPTLLAAGALAAMLRRRRRMH